MSELLIIIRDDQTRCYLDIDDHVSQIQDMLLDMNSSLNIPASLRYDISLPNETHDYDAYDLEHANAEIQDARKLVESGQCPQHSYQQFRSQVEASLARRHVRKLANLERLIPTPVLNPDPVDAVLQPEYLTSKAQDAYLVTLDASLGDQWSLSQTLPPAPVKFGEMTPRELEREIELRNPHSVHSWLKKHKSEQEQLAEDAASEAAVATPATNRKRATNLAKKMGDRAVNRARQGTGADGDVGSPASMARGDTDAGDDDVDDSIVLSASARKKGGDKDDTYRPKGGRSSKGKRKRETDGAAEGGKGKKARTSVPAAIAAAAPDV